VNLLLCIVIMNHLKPDASQKLDKFHYLKEIATLETDNSIIEKWLQEFYHKLEKAPKIFAKEL
jgi:flavorubredoxin